MRAQGHLWKLTAAQGHLGTKCYHAQDSISLRRGAEAGIWALPQPQAGKEGWWLWYKGGTPVWPALH